ncbi:sorbitol dehydrogenase, partial [Biomphalaria pfeifferi]
MTDTNLALTLFQEKDLRLVETPIPEPQEGEVQLSVRSVGICGSDISYWQHGRIGKQVVTNPKIMGHEPSAVVSKLGPGVTRFKVGDRVAVEPLNPCGKCSLCKAGHYNVCVDLKYLSTPPTNGCLCRYFCHPASFVHRLPDDVSFDEGALVQPLAVALHACERGEITIGNYVFVAGAGPMGLMAVLVAKARGASKVCVSDVVQSRLDFIKTIGADETILVGMEEDPKVTSQRVIKTLGQEVHVAIECSGQQNAVSTAIYCTRPTGKVVLVGLGKDTVEVPLVSAILKQLDILGMVRFSN